MAKNRKFPFGYMMQNGTITTNPKEVLAVVTIFRSYLNGESLVDIAKAMEVPYNEGVAWNKNMVKRIIENEKYLGTDKYPQLIDEDTFRRANAKKEKKALSLCVISEELQQVRNLTFCKECGHRLFRRGGKLFSLILKLKTRPVACKLTQYLFLVRKPIASPAGCAFVNGAVHVSVIRCKERVCILCKKLCSQRIFSLFDRHGILADMLHPCTEIGGNAVLFSVQHNNTDDSGKMQTVQWNIRYGQHQGT